MNLLDDLRAPSDDANNQSLAEPEPFPGLDSAESMTLGLSLYHQHVEFEFERGFTFINSLAGNLRYTEKRLPTSRKARIEIANEIVHSLEEWAYHSFYPQFWMDLGAGGLTTRPPEWINLTLTRAYLDVARDLKVAPQAVWYEPAGENGGSPHWHQATAQLLEWVTALFPNRFDIDRPVMKIIRTDERGNRIGDPFLVRCDLETQVFEYPPNTGVDWIPVHSVEGVALKILPHLTWLKKDFLERVKNSVGLRRRFIQTRLDQEFAVALTLCSDEQWRKSLIVNQNHRLNNCEDSSSTRIGRLKPTEKKVYGIVSRSRTRLNTNQVLSAMMESPGPSGESNTKAALANLVAIGLLTNAKDDLGQGYASTNLR